MWEMRNDTFAKIFADTGFSHGWLRGHYPCWVADGLGATDNGRGIHCDDDSLILVDSLDGDRLVTDKKECVVCGRKAVPESSDTPVCNRLYCFDRWQESEASKRSTAARVERHDASKCRVCNDPVQREEWTH